MTESEEKLDVVKLGLLRPFGVNSMSAVGVCQGELVLPSCDGSRRKMWTSACLR